MKVAVGVSVDLLGHFEAAVVVILKLVVAVLLPCWLAKKMMIMRIKENEQII